MLFHKFRYQRQSANIEKIVSTSQEYCDVFTVFWQIFSIDSAKPLCIRKVKIASGGYNSTDCSCKPCSIAIAVIMIWLKIKYFNTIYEIWLSGFYTWPEWMCLNKQHIRILILGAELYE